MKKRPSLTPHDIYDYDEATYTQLRDDEVTDGAQVTQPVRELVANAVSLHVASDNTLLCVLECADARVTLPIDVERAKMLRDALEKHIFAHTHYNLAK